eukprot:GHVN01034026.1.p1 GENE.GHVN01034026.1~~GHVN01034026.1.p1  ORF type:complete len:129 (+),score=13.58 GHVN01034026.1:453-839(+)
MDQDIINVYKDPIISLLPKQKIHQPLKCAECRSRVRMASQQIRTGPSIHLVWVIGGPASHLPSNQVPQSNLKFECSSTNQENLAVVECVSGCQSIQSSVINTEPPTSSHPDLFSLRSQRHMTNHQWVE